MSVHFLPPEDREFLDIGHYKWEPLTENSKNGLVIQKYTLPEGYVPKESDLMVLIPPGYPVSPIDMFYFDPGISRDDGKPIDALADEIHFGRKWQRWSRHYAGLWRSGIDNVATHITYVSNQLKFELKNG